MITDSLVKTNGDEYRPEEAALIMRLRVFVTMRWLAIAGVIVATLLATQVFNINFPYLPVYIICPFIALYNLVFYLQLRQLDRDRSVSVIQRARFYGNIHIFLDLLTLTVLLHFSGGIENPFIFFYVFHIILASIALHYRIVYIAATVAIFMISILVILEYTGAIPHVNLEGFAEPTLYRKPGYIIAILVALASILYGTAYMATAISGELRKRQRQVVQIRDRLLEEKTGELERASNEVAKLAEEKNRFLRFLSIAAHDLKAPLTAIQGFLWVILGGYAGDINDKQRNMLDRSSKRINELLNLISDLLDIPRIETGQIIPEMKEISFRQVVKTCIQSKRDLAREKSVKLKVEIPETLSKIRGSSPRLQQVLNNIVDNAINYSPEGQVIVRVIEKEKLLQVEVADTGIGIPASDISKVFDDFFRAGNVDTKGTGLGLSIAKRIVEAHGGKIWCESPCLETNHGSRFYFSLPKGKKGVRRQRL